MTNSSVVEPVVTLTEGAVLGRREGAGFEFFGLPIARAPVGPNRFGLPVRPLAWEGIRDATAWGPTPQRRQLAPVTTIPEPSVPGDETLNATVCTPTLDRGARLPVLVWIHGGGYVAGSPVSPWYSGGAFVARGIVVVRLSYRLGFDGFGAIPGAPTNRALHDLVRGFDWVEENIEAFGGDPSAVTIAGQSAGGGLALALLGAEGVAARCRGAILQSPALAFSLPEEADDTARRMASLVGIENTAEQWRATPESRLIDAQATIFAGDGTLSTMADTVERTLVIADRVHLPFSPLLDGETLAVNPVVAAADAVRGAVPLLVGTTLDEFVAPAESAAPDAEFQAWLDRAHGKGLLRSWSAPATESDRFGRLLTDVLFRDPVRSLVERRRGATAPTWSYDFAWRGANGLASHCFDLPFSWGALDAPGVAEALGPDTSRALAERMHGAWVSFIRGDGATWAPGELERFDA